MELSTGIYWLECKIKEYKTTLFTSKNVYGDSEETLNYFTKKIAELEYAVETLKNIDKLIFNAEREARAQTWDDAAEMIMAPSEVLVDGATCRTYAAGFRLLAAMQRGDVHE